MKRFKMNKATERSAYTLVELMVTTVVFSILMLGVFQVYLSTTRVSSGAISQLAIQAQARTGLDSVINDVRRCQSAIIYTTYNGAATFTGSTNADFGSYIIFNISSNSLRSGELAYHHYYMGNLKSLGNGVTNGTLYAFSTPAMTNLTGKTTDYEVVRGVTNPDRVFDWINGVVNINVRIADENDFDGKQIIYLRSAVAFRNGD